MNCVAEKLWGVCQLPFSNGLAYMYVCVYIYNLSPPHLQKYIIQAQSLGKRHCRMLDFCQTLSHAEGVSLGAGKGARGWKFFFLPFWSGSLKEGWNSKPSLAEHQLSHLGSINVVRACNDSITAGYLQS